MRAVILTLTLTAWWIFPDPSNTFGSFVGKPVGPTTAANVLSLTVGSDGIASYETSIGGSIESVVDPASDVRGGWHHIGASWDGATRRLYIDGVLHGAKTGGFDDSTLPIAIGADLDDGTLNIGYIGAVDDLRFYPRTLADAEIAAILTEP